MPKTDYAKKFMGAEPSDPEKEKRTISTVLETLGKKAAPFLIATDESGKEVRIALFFNRERVVSDEEAKEAIDKWHIEPSKFEYLRFSTIGDKIIPGSKPRGFEWKPED